MRPSLSLKLVALAWGLWSCGEQGYRHDPSGAGACIADELGELHLSTSVPDCASGKIGCQVKCRLADATACLGIAYLAEGSSSPEEVRSLYRRACFLGAANACTNYAASVWMGKTTDAQVACARRTFEKACAVKEQFACGMVGRVMLESGGSPDYRAGQEYLQAACGQTAVSLVASLPSTWNPETSVDTTPQSYRPCSSAPAMVETSTRVANPRLPGRRSTEGRPNARIKLTKPERIGAGMKVTSVG